MIIGRVFDAVNGTVALTSDGNVGFTPDADYNGPAQFSYEANTPEGGEAIATVFIDVTPVNDAPTARNDTGFSGDENTTFVIAAADLLANDSDIDGDGFTLLSVASTAQLLVSLNADGDVEVTPRSPISSVPPPSPTRSRIPAVRHRRRRCSLPSMP
jgi:hypothetical protein